MALKKKSPAKKPATQVRKSASEADALVAQLRAATKPGERVKLVKAIGALGAAGGPAVDALGALIGAVQMGSDRVDSSVKVAFAAVDALAAIGEPAVAKLREWVKTKESARRQRVVITIASLPPELLRREIGLLVRVARTWELPKEAAEKLAAIPDATLAAFRPLLATDSRSIAAAVLRHLGPRAAPALADLERALASRDGDSAAWKILDAIGMIGPAARSAAPSILPVLTEGEIFEWAGLEALLAIGAVSEGVEPALRAIDTSDSQRVLLAALGIVRQVSDRADVVAALRKLAMARDSLLYGEAWEAIAGLGAARALPIAREALTSTSNDVYRSGPLIVATKLGREAAPLRAEVERWSAHPTWGSWAKEALAAIDAG